MFLKKLFNFGKDYNHYLEKGDRFLAAERFADARNAYGEALEKMEASGEGDHSRTEAVRQKIALTGNMLGRLNLAEAEHALSSGDREKAAEHLRIILDLADDATLRESSERLLAVIRSEAPDSAQVAAIHNCGSCEEAEPDTGNDDQHGMNDEITGEDRLTLYFQTLPGDLPERYAGMGKEFARGCLSNLEGNGEQALRVFEELSAEMESDIVDYEKAVIYFHNGDSVM